MTGFLNHFFKTSSSSWRTVCSESLHHQRHHQNPSENQPPEQIWLHHWLCVEQHTAFRLRYKLQHFPSEQQQSHVLSFWCVFLFSFCVDLSNYLQHCDNQHAVNIICSAEINHEIENHAARSADTHVVPQCHRCHQETKPPSTYHRGATYWQYKNLGFKHVAYGYFSVHASI